MRIVLLVFYLFFGAVTQIYADSTYDEIYRTYPEESYFVGIGEVTKSGNSMNDKRVSGIYARLEIAKQIKVRIREETVDFRCEGSASQLFRDILECKNEFIMIVEITVDEFLQGSKIVDQGENEKVAYAVAVMPKKEVVENIEKNIKKSLDKTKESIEKAKKGDKDAIKEARDEYLKALIYDKEKELIEGVQSRSSDVFEELEKELVKLRENK